MIRATLESVPGPPPPNQPSVELPAAACPYVAELSGPRTLAVAVSVAYVIRSTLERPRGAGGAAPPANQP